MIYAFFHLHMGVLNTELARFIVDTDGAKQVVLFLIVIRGTGAKIVQVRKSTADIIK